MIKINTLHILLLNKYSRHLTFSRDIQPKTFRCPQILITGNGSPQTPFSSTMVPSSHVSLQHPHTITLTFFPLSQLSPSSGVHFSHVKKNTSKNVVYIL